LLGGKKVHPRRQNPGYAYEGTRKNEEKMQKKHTKNGRERKKQTSKQKKTNKKHLAKNT